MSLYCHQELTQDKQQRKLALRALGALRKRLQQLQPFAKDDNRFVVRIPLCVRVCHLLEIVNGSQRLAAALEVDGKLGRDASRLLAIACRQTLPNALMQLPPPHARQTPVQHLGI